MAFFPRSIAAHEATPSSFHPLFRLLDDFDHYNRTTNDTKSHRSVMKSFTPNFDVKEIGDVYELHGDLPGIDQKDISIEFSDAQTLTVKGRTERSYTSGTPAGAIEPGSAPKAIDDASHKEHQPTVEDEDTTVATKNASGSTEVSKHEPKEPEAKYWVSERSVGEFSRSFTFPVRVDQDSVHASMKNGVLSVVVPKAKKVEARKIAIN